MEKFSVDRYSISEWKGLKTGRHAKTFKIRNELILNALGLDIVDKKAIRDFDLGHA